jgi:hypothetical protein
VAQASANPAQFFEFTFTADARTDYRLWLRGKALNDFWGNDSVFVKFDDSIDAGDAPSTHTISVQTREDGLSIDQIVLSSARFLNASPGALKNDTTILAACQTPPLRQPGNVTLTASFLHALPADGRHSQNRRGRALLPILSLHGPDNCRSGR